MPDDYFDALAGIQELSSDNVHEGSWAAWDATKLGILLELTKNVLHEMYVAPEEQKQRVAAVATMREAFKIDKAGGGQPDIAGTGDEGAEGEQTS